MAKDDIQTMLRAIINGQSAFRQEVLKKFKAIDDRFNNLETGFNKRLDDLTHRIDKIGKQLAFLEDDTPTREEFDNLKVRVDKVEQKLPAAV